MRERERKWGIDSEWVVLGGGERADKQKFTSVSVATSPISSRALRMNIHHVHSSIPSHPFCSYRTAQPSADPSNGDQSKAEITIRVCPVDEARSAGVLKQIEKAQAGRGGSRGERLPVVIAFELEITF